MMAIFVFLGLFFGSKLSHADNTLTVVQNTAPIGKVRLAGDIAEDEKTPLIVAESSANQPAVADIGKTTYQGICVACHGSGIPNIPQLGDVADWTARIEQGNEILYDRAINGYTGASGMPMPAKGGNPALTDEEVKAAVDYIVINSQ